MAIESLETSGVRTAVFAVLVVIVAGAFAVKMASLFLTLAGALPQ
jgi:hypothetical protein